MSKLAYVRVAAPAAALFLSACGGGGGGGGPAPIVPPPPAPPPALTYATLPLTASASFETIDAVRSYTVPPGANRTVDEFGVSGRNSGLVISYDASSGAYTVTDPVATSTFTSADRSASNYFDTYTTAFGTTTDQLRLYSNVRSDASQAGAPIKLTYLSFGSWSHDDSASGEHRDTYFLFGYPTVESDMPKSGTASYSTIVRANIVSMMPGQGEAPINGSATFTADFASGTVDTSLTLPLQYFGSASSTYDGSGTISGNQFSGVFTSKDDGSFKSGSFAGGFFGPSADEMGYTFAISRGEADPYAGAALQPALVWVVGAVVGTKKAP